MISFIFRLLRNLFRSETVITLAEARQNAKACYLNEDLDGAAKWNEVIAKIVSSEKSANAG